LTITRLFIDETIAANPQVRTIRERIGAAAVRVVDDARKVYDTVRREPDPVAAGKKTLYLTANRGPFVRECPGTRQYQCCGYRILHVGAYCVMDCAYCILQSYFHPPVLQFFVNHDDMHRELDLLFAQEQVVRIGTGEFTDSLIWERWTSLAQELVTAFSGQQRAVLELKTKTTAVDSLLGLDHQRKTIVAWSLNTERVIRKEERNTASLAKRLTAASRCAAAGYPLAFHFDPMVIYDGCEEDYRRVVAALFARIDPDDIVWLSMGSFRFMPALKPIVERRFPESKLVFGEFVPGLDGKMRYFNPLRIRLYRTLVDEIRRFAPDAAVYLCMEDESTWQRSFGFSPGGNEGLARMLDRAAVKHCGLDERLLAQQRRTLNVESKLFGS
jgi:spore photoproduct lyase